MDQRSPQNIIQEQHLLITKLKQLNSIYENEIIEINKKFEKQLLEQSCIDKRIQIVKGRKKCSEDILRIDLEQLENQIQIIQNQYQQQIDKKKVLKYDYKTLVSEQNKLQEEKDDLLMEIKQINQKINEMNLNQLNAQLELDSINSQIEKAQQQIQLMTYEKDLQKQETQDQTLFKRQLSNTLQEAKGTIRVYCRVRAFLNDEVFDDKDENLLQISNHNTLYLNVPNQFMKSSNNVDKYQFNFDQVFDRASLQTDIFNELQQLIASVIDGHNVCIFAYGQTGSGKTYTMQGQQAEKAGVIPRAVALIFNQIDSMNGLGASLFLKVGFHEIYNETIRDLIHNCQTEEIGQVKVANMEEIGMYFQKATENRKVAETQCNEFSSRSHFIFQIQVSGTNVKGKTINGALNLIDLAGSERLNQCKTEGDRLKETQAINKSLTALGDVINALAQKEKFVPFRNSKLTHVLYQYMQGKTLMLVNISPRWENFQSTLQSLRFAEKVKNCKANNQQQKQIKK